MTDPIQIIDTFKISSSGIHLKKYHIQRTLEGFAELGIAVNEFSVRAMYQQIEEKNLNLKKEMKAKITFDHQDLRNSICDISDIENLPNPITLELPTSGLFQLSGCGLQNFKISKRDYWNQALKNAHCFDTIGVNQDGNVTETSRFNLFLFKDNLLFTPELNSGCINGAYRRFLLAHGSYDLAGQKIQIIEKNILALDIKKYEIFVGNSLRGMHKAVLI